MKHFGSIDELASAPADRLTDVDDVGSVTADAVRAFFDDEQNIRIIDRLKEAGVNMKMEEPAEQAEQIFEGKTFVITGTLPSMDRKAAAAVAIFFIIIPSRFVFAEYSAFYYIHYNTHLRKNQP